MIPVIALIETDPDKVEELPEYEFITEYRIGKSIGDADAFCRWQCPSECRLCTSQEEKNDAFIEIIRTDTMKQRKYATNIRRGR
ncbi:hypothetical protein EVAR_24316_1 [Eumeta japonica]|uniref:Uncharacterized protein n=1 Tax=Eumeta variegata TaxID=151549 RepID=A0A4C1VNI7_EUMVA|nr:hypothetical protein EVAR_24316_1 [Eumeta japonica]